MVIVKGTPIAVDQFNEIPGVSHYFLSHMHSDHTSGLTSSWSRGQIYCTEITKHLLLNKFASIEEERITVLSTEKVNFIYLDGRESVQIQVTVFDANHCPGACMFLFEGYFGIFLHTGDFRFCETMIQDERLTRVFGKIDRLYLDDTFIHEPDNDFPTRDVVGTEIVRIVAEYSNKHGPKSTFIVAVDSLGKEELLIALGLTLKSLVVVSEERMRTINILKNVTEMVDVFTSNPRLGRIVALSKSDMRKKNILKIRKKRPNTIGIVPTGLFSKRYFAEKKRLGGKTPVHTIYRLPYTNHSSYNELERFMRAVRPKTLYSASLKNTKFLNQEFGKFCSDEDVVLVKVPKMLELEMNRYESSRDPLLAISEPLLLRGRNREDLRMTKFKIQQVNIASPEKEVVDLTKNARKEEMMEIIDLEEDEEDLGEEEGDLEENDDIEELPTPMTPHPVVFEVSSTEEEFDVMEEKENNGGGGYFSKKKRKKKKGRRKFPKTFSFNFSPCVKITGKKRRLEEEENGRKWKKRKT